MTPLEEIQRKCQHSFGEWQRREKICTSLYSGVHDVIFTRVCQLCMSVEYEQNPIELHQYQSDNELITPSAEAVFKDKMSFIINMATAVVKQRPGTLICYVAGKVTGLPKNEVRNKFARKKRELELQGYIVLNPCDFISPDENWQIAMRMALPLLMMSDVICMLPCWEDSPGAKVEFELATQMGISTITI